MKAITVWQPWASLLACGAKKYETRSWATEYRGPLAIHAAAMKPTHDTIARCIEDDIPFLTTAANALDIDLGEWLSWGRFDDLPRGCIIATAELVGCWRMWDGRQAGFGKGVVCIDRPNQYWSPNWVAVTNEYLFGDWTPGRYAWEFANMKMLDTPIPAKGRQRLWDWEGACDDRI